MQPLEFSTDPLNRLNDLRQRLWCAKEALGRCNRGESTQTAGQCMTHLNKDRAALMRYARGLRDAMRNRRVWGMSVADQLRQAIDEYWDIAWQEGARKTAFDELGKAMDCRHKIEGLIQDLEAKCIAELSKHLSESRDREKELSEALTESQDWNWLDAHEEMIDRVLRKYPISEMERLSQIEEKYRLRQIAD